MCIRDRGLAVKSGGNTNIIASEINVGGDALFDVGKNLNVFSGKENSYDYSYKKKNSLGGLKSSKDKIDEKTSDVVKSQINVGKNLNLISGLNTNITGSDINVGGDANILAGYKVNKDGSIEKSGGKEMCIRDRNRSSEILTLLTATQYI